MIQRWIQRNWKLVDVCKIRSICLLEQHIKGCRRKASSLQNASASPRGAARCCDTHCGGPMLAFGCHMSPGCISVPSRSLSGNPRRWTWWAGNKKTCGINQFQWTGIFSLKCVQSGPWSGGWLPSLKLYPGSHTACLFRKWNWMMGPSRFYMNSWCLFTFVASLDGFSTSLESKRQLYNFQWPMLKNALQRFSCENIGKILFWK